MVQSIQPIVLYCMAQSINPTIGPAMLAQSIQPTISPAMLAQSISPTIGNGCTIGPIN